MRKQNFYLMFVYVLFDVSVIGPLVYIAPSNSHFCC